MAVSRDVARTRFASFVRAALVRARNRGMTDDAIAAATKIGDSTFHRWAKGDWATMPKLDKVASFCEGLGEPVERAFAALGIIGGPAVPEPTVDPDVALVARRLNDPGVPESEKVAIRHMLRLLSGRGPAQESSRAQPTG